jgi:hypothetical protein
MPERPASCGFSFTSLKPVFRRAYRKACCRASGPVKFATVIKRIEKRLTRRCLAADSARSLIRFPAL